ncbi:MAG: hypothetical protein LBB72_04655, partial [Spirochaetaceae bacterium]|nr:hypothetical protein [Spirochaetaceae bacterium]
MTKEAVRLRKEIKAPVLAAKDSAANRPALIARTAAPAKSYPNTLQRLARHYWYTGKDKNIVKLADELERRPEVAVVCVTSEKKQPLGIIRREQLFLSLSRRFGREIMSRYTVKESAETVPVYAGE